LRPQKAWIPAALILLALSAPRAATVWVDAVNGNDTTGTGTQASPVQTINQGFQIAQDGDTIRVKAGTYNECVRATWFDTNPYEPRSVQIVADAYVNGGDNTATIIDGGSACPSGVSVVNLGGINTRLEGFTIRGGTSSGVYALGSPTITHNVITSNTSSFGGGIYVYSAACYYGTSTVSVTNNQVTNNSAFYDQTLSQGGEGGGIYVFAVGVQDPSCVNGNVGVTVASNTISNNTVQGDTMQGGTNRPFGGGLVVFTDSDPARSVSVAVTQNSITNNRALAGSTSYGGGAWVTTYGYGQELIDVTNNTFAANNSTGDGGGLSAWILTFEQARHVVTVQGNTLTGNTALGNGGGMDLFMFADDLLPTQRLELTATGNTVTGNSAQGNFGGGGGILGTVFSNRSNTVLSPMEFTISGNRVANNTSTFMGGGVGLFLSADADPNLDGATSRATAQIDLLNNLVSENSASGSGLAPGGGVFAYMQAFGDALNTTNVWLNTIADNSSEVNAGGIHVEQLSDFDTNFNDEGINAVTVNSNIIAGNDRIGLGGPGPGQVGAITPGTGFFNLSIDVSYDNFFNNTGGAHASGSWIHIGSGNLEGVDPGIASPLYVPDSCSPTIDAGDPTLDFSLEPGANGGRVNMGHTGGTASAAPALPDLTGDGTVDGIDVVRFATAFNSNLGDPRFLAVADLDGDGFVGPDDLAFLAPLYGMSCP